MQRVKHSESNRLAVRSGDGEGLGSLAILKRRESNLTEHQAKLTHHRGLGIRASWGDTKSRQPRETLFLGFFFRRLLGRLFFRRFEFESPGDFQLGKTLFQVANSVIRNFRLPEVKVLQIR